MSHILFPALSRKMLPRCRRWPFMLPGKSSQYVALRRFALAGVLPKCRCCQLSLFGKSSLFVALRVFRHAKICSLFVAPHVFRRAKCSQCVAARPFCGQGNAPRLVDEGDSPLPGRDFGTSFRAWRGARARKMKPKCGFWWLRAGRF